MSKIFILVGPSGAGKTTIANIMSNKGVPELVSDTTRKPRKGEINGKAYYFKTLPEFEKIEFVEPPAFYAGNYYALSKREVLEKTKNNEVVFCVMEIKGALLMKEKFKNVQIIFITASIENLKQRMIDRGDKVCDIEKRLNQIKDLNETENSRFADYVILNNSNIEKTIDKVLKIISFS